MAASRRPPDTGRTWPERLAITVTIVAAVRLASSPPPGWSVATPSWQRPRDRRHRQPGHARPPHAEAAPATTADRLGARRSAGPPPRPPGGADHGAARDVPAGRSDGEELPHHRGRQRGLHRPELAVRGRLRRPRARTCGERSDTIMVFRVDPAAVRVAVLSFPRDLYVPIAGSGNQARINTAYRRDEPQRLIDTIYENFGVGDRPLHPGRLLRVQDAGRRRRRRDGAVRVPGPGRGHGAATCRRRAATRSTATTPSPTCGRGKYEYEDPPGQRQLGDATRTSDLGRISRQQDFLRRTLSSVLAKGLLDPSVARGLIETATSGNVVTDPGLSLAKLMEFAGVMRDRPTRRHPHVPDRGRRPRGQRGQRAGAHDRWRQHAGRPGHVPGRDVAGRRARAGVRGDDDGGPPPHRRGRDHRSRPRRSRRRPSRPSRAPRRRTPSASSRPATSSASELS